MGDKHSRIQLTSLYFLHESWRRIAVHHACVDTDISVPNLVQREFGGFAVNSQYRYLPSNCHERLAYLPSHGRADAFHYKVAAVAVGSVEYAIDGATIRIENAIGLEHACMSFYTLTKERQRQRDRDRESLTAPSAFATSRRFSLRSTAKIRSPRGAAFLAHSTVARPSGPAPTTARLPLRGNFPERSPISNEVGRTSLCWGAEYKVGTVQDTTV